MIPVEEYLRKRSYIYIYIYIIYIYSHIPLVLLNAQYSRIRAAKEARSRDVLYQRPVVKCCRGVREGDEGRVSLQAAEPSACYGRSSLPTVCVELFALVQQTQLGSYHSKSPIAKATLGPIMESSMWILAPGFKLTCSEVYLTVGVTAANCRCANCTILARQCVLFAPSCL